MPEYLEKIYYIYGDEFQVDEALRRLKKRVATGGDARLSVKEFSGEAAMAAEAIMAAQTLPFFGETTLVIIRRADRLDAREKDKLAGYAANPSPAAIMVLTAEKATKSDKLVKAVEKAGRVHEYKAPKSAELVSWVGNTFKEKDKKISRDDAARLIETVGTDQSALTQEIEKISVYVGTAESVGADDIETVATHNPEASIFTMVDAIGLKHGDTAIMELSKLLYEGEPSPRILHMIVRQFRILLKAKALEERRASVAEYAPTLGVKPFLVDRCRRQAKNFTMSELKQIYGVLKDTDVAMKTGQREPNLALEMLIGKITGEVVR